MLSDKINEILNEQIKKEGYSSNLYLAMASWAEVNGFEGTSNWLYAQADEERAHMMKILKYVNERGGRAVIPSMDNPPKDFTNVKEMFEAVLEHEVMISNSINEIVALCITEKDYTTHNWIQWFVNEQIEEEANVKTILDKLNLAGAGSMYLFDRDIMGLRKTDTSANI